MTPLPEIPVTAAGREPLSIVGSEGDRRLHFDRLFLWDKQAAATGWGGFDCGRDGWYDATLEAGALRLRMVVSADWLRAPERHRKKTGVASVAPAAFSRSATAASNFGLRSIDG